MFRCHLGVSFFEGTKSFSRFFFPGRNKKGEQNKTKEQPLSHVGWFPKKGFAQLWSARGYGSTNVTGGQMALVHSTYQGKPLPFFWTSQARLAPFLVFPITRASHCLFWTHRQARLAPFLGQGPFLGLGQPPKTAGRSWKQPGRQDGELGALLSCAGS